jgi:acyl-CoA reductase-like NAD-dependent aldehyde dehydrogenase
MTDSLTISTPQDTPEPAAPVYRYYAGGEWKDSASGETFDSYEPYTGRVFARVAAGGAHEMGDAIDAAHAAFPGLRSTCG